jgi:hypothetical protein
MATCIDGIAYVLSYIYCLSNKLENKYNKYDNIVTHVFKKDKYDNKHSIVVLFSILDIKISTIEFNNIKCISVYKDNKCLSLLTLNKYKPINTNIKVILKIEYLDNFKIKNLLEVYNCGIIIHKNCYTSHIYNYKGERRNHYQPIINNSLSVNKSMYSLNE